MKNNRKKPPFGDLSERESTLFFVLGMVIASIALLTLPYIIDAYF